MKEGLSLRIEIESDGKRWIEGGRCPIKVAGMPCGGTLKRRVEGNSFGLECSSDSYYHYVSVSLAQTEVLK